MMYINKWKCIKNLGTGAFGSVDLWQNQENAEYVAIKKCKLNPKDLDSEEFKKAKDRWIEEWKIMNQIKHENIVRTCPDLCKDLLKEINKIVDLQVPAIAMEYCNAGSLRDKLQEKGNVNGLSEYDVREVLRALKDAIYYLHTKHKITHRDIKPDNIVLKTRCDGKIIYKLTDVGYARIIDTNTIAGSAVGTQNYFAPEIVINAEYKNSVDYWSMGVLAFEIMCGVHPFLHGEVIFNVIGAINKSPPGYIAVTRNIDKTLEFHKKLFPENRLSLKFSDLIVSWLKLALDKDGRKRGYDESNEFKFYTLLEAILNTKILTVFWINKCKYLSYIITESMTMETLYEGIATDTSSTRLSLIFPSCHTYSRMTPNMKPIHLYDEKFAIDDQPMMYLIIFDGNDLCIPDAPSIPTTIRQLLGGRKEHLCNVNLLLCMLHLDFIHQNEQKRCLHFRKGLYELAISLEDNIMHLKRSVYDYNSKIVEYNGQVTHFEAMVTSVKKLHEQNQNSFIGSLDTEFEHHALNFKNLFAAHSDIIQRYEGILSVIRNFIEQIQVSPIERLLEQITDKVVKFQENRFDKCPDRKDLDSFISVTRTELTDLLNMRRKFYEAAKEWLMNNNLVSNGTASDTLNKIEMQYQTIYGVLQESQKRLNDAQMELKESTDNYLRQVFHQKELQESRQYRSLCEQMDTIDLSDISSVSPSVLVQQNENLISL